MTLSQDTLQALHEAATKIPSRTAYEGAGGWKDGRFGQAFDLIAEALRERGVLEMRSHPLLVAIEMEDGNYE